jgi:ATP-dependent helicase/nuclease subunit A
MISGQPEMNALGMALHEFLAADRPVFSSEARVELAIRCLANRQVSGALRPEDLLEASARLNRWVAQVAPGARWHRELPVTLRQADGAVVRGTADLVLELEDGFHVVDHKAYPGAEFEKRAAGHAGQLNAYAAALEAAWGKRCAGTWIHLPNLGHVVHVTG